MSSYKVFYKKLSDGTVIYTEKGRKSAKDFIVRARLPNGKRITPKHAHFAIDLYGKLCANEAKALKVFELITRVYRGENAENVINSLSQEELSRLNELPGYTVEYILYCLQLIFEQEDVNYPKPRYEGRDRAYRMLKNIAEGKHPVEALLEAGLRI